MNNITVDGSYFNNSFGLAGQPGDRTGVAPISLEAIEQVQVNVAPYDVRQGNFVGATVNTVTRSGSNRYTASVYYRMRNESFVGKEQSGLAFNPGTFETTDLGEWAGGPIVKNKLFFFESYESQKDKRPLTTYTSNPGGVPATGNTTRVLASDLEALSSFLKSKFDYDTGPFDGLTDETPAKPFLLKLDYNLNGSNRISFRYNQLNSSSDSYLSGSGSWGYSGGRRTYTNDYLTFKNSTYSILENIKSGIGEWNSVISQTMTNNLIIGYTTQDESRADIQLFPFVDILKEGTVYTSIGSELYTPSNKLLYHTFQAQDSFTKYGRSHSLTFGGAIEKYHSDNSYLPRPPEHLRLQLAGRLLHRRQRLPRQPEPHDVARHGVEVPGGVFERRGTAGPAVPDARRVVHERVRAGRLEAAIEPDHHRRAAHGHCQLR